MRFLFAGLLVVLTASSSWAQVLCQTFGNQTFCSNGQTSLNFGNQSFGSWQAPPDTTLQDVQAGLAMDHALRHAWATDALVAKYGQEYNDPAAALQAAEAQSYLAQASRTQYNFNVTPPDGQRVFGGVSAAGTPAISGNLNRLFGPH
jgi:hypothetical protein